MRCNRVSAVLAMVFVPLLLPAFQQVQTASLEGTALDSVTGTPIPLASGETRSGVELRMIPTGVIAGRVLNNLGEPVPGIVMYAARISYEGRRRKMTAAEYSLLATDDRGDYRVYGLPPGRYYVAAVELKDFVNFGGSGAEGVDAADAPPKDHLGLQYYSGVADPAQATAVELRAGEEKAGLDFRYDYTPLVSVFGHVSIPALCPGRLDFQVDREIATDQKYPVQFASSPDGSFELRGISPGSWRISAGAREQKTNSMCSTETATVQVGASGADGVALALRPWVDARLRRARPEDRGLREPDDTGSFSADCEVGRNYDSLAARLEPLAAAHAAEDWPLAADDGKREFWLQFSRFRVAIPYQEVVTWAER